MTLFIPLYLTVFSRFYGSLQSFDGLWVTGMPKYTQGYVKDGEVYICPNNLTMPRQEVINHEVVHLIQSNLGVDTLLPHSTIDIWFS